MRLLYILEVAPLLTLLKHVNFNKLYIPLRFSNGQQLSLCVRYKFVPVKYETALKTARQYRFNDCASTVLGVSPKLRNCSTLAS